MIDWLLFLDYYPYLLKGTLYTILITLGSLSLGILIGPILSFCEIKGNRFLKFLVSFYVTIIRGTPMLIQIVSFFYILPSLGIELGPMLTAIMAIGLNSAAYMSQTMKVGVLSVETGQLQAAKILGYTPLQIGRYILFPQAFKKILPALGNEMVTLIKDSSLASIIGVMELSKQGAFIRTRTYDPISVLFFVGIIYLCLTGSLSFLVSKLEERNSR